MILLDNDGEGHELSGPPAAVWIALDGAADRREIAERLAQAGVAVDEASVRALDEALDQLVERGLVVGEATPEPDGPT